MDLNIRHVSLVTKKIQIKIAVMAKKSVLFLLFMLAVSLTACTTSKTGQERWIHIPLPPDPLRELVFGFLSGKPKKETVFYLKDAPTQANDTRTSARTVGEPRSTNQSLQPVRAEAPQAPLSTQAPRATYAPDYVEPAPPGYMFNVRKIPGAKPGKEFLIRGVTGSIETLSTADFKEFEDECVRMGWKLNKTN
jgi:hypothetical protein